MAREHQKTIAAILSSKDDFEVSTEIPGRIADYHGEDLDVSKLPREERAVLLAETAMGMRRGASQTKREEGQVQGSNETATRQDRYTNPRRCVCGNGVDMLLESL